MILSFSKDRFVHAIVAGDKKTTIREDNGDRWKPGRTIQFWRGSPRNIRREPKPYQFGNAVCHQTKSISIMRSTNHKHGFAINLDGENLSDKQIEQVCKLDGLTPREFRMWFLPGKKKIFHGKQIRWRNTNFTIVF